MCVIIDNCCAHHFTNAHKEFVPFLNALLSAKRTHPKLACCEDLVAEYPEDMRSILATMDSVGRVRYLPEDLIAAEKAAISGKCRSNDIHVLAAVRVGPVRVLCTHDQALKQDYLDPDLVPRPRGKLYSNKSHMHLVWNACRGIACKQQCGGKGNRPS